MTDDASTERDPLDLLVEEFTRRLRAGELVDIPAFAAEHAAHREALLDLLPTLQTLEQCKRDRESTGSRLARVALPDMHQLGDFRIVREIGRGGMGVVFEAFQESLSRKVALKVLPQAALLTGNQLMRFQREAQIAAQLHHSNIVPVFGSGETDGYHWYAMQFIVGDGLDSWRKNEQAKRPHGTSQWRDRAGFVARIGEQVASALHYAHSQGTLHRDIKPANLLLDREGHAWVTDFGLAKALEAEGLTQSGDLLGTLQYMAPEQFAGLYDARSEVYALGVTLYELLTLQAAYAGNTKSELMDAIRRGRPTSMRRLCPDAPGDLLTVIETACARDPADRYASAEDLQHDLQAFLEDRQIAARRQSAAGQMLRWCRRNRATAALLAATLLAVVAAGITGWVAYVTTDSALAQAKTSGEEAEQESRRAEANLRLSLAAFGELFDALVGRDPLLMFEEDPDTGEQYVIATRAVDDQDIALLAKMLSFYDDFAAQNAQSQSLRFETARAYRRVGVIRARLGKLDEAAAAYDQSLERYTDVTDRDITRELAAVHIEYGQLEQRRWDPLAAAQRFRLALKLLDREPPVGDNAALRFERAKAHYLLARNARAPGHERSRRSRSPDGERGGRGPGGGRRSDWRARSEEARRHLGQAQSIVATLSAEDGANPDVRAFEARCLLLSARLAAPDDVERAVDATAGLEILRELVKAQPAAVSLRFELCETLLDMARQRASEDRLAWLRLARDHAVVLVENRADLREYRALRARVGGDLGMALMRAVRDQPEAEKPETLRLAEAELRLAIADPELSNPMRAVMSAGQLDALLRADGRVAQADVVLEQVFAAVAELIAREDGSDRRSVRFGGRGERRPGGARSVSPEFERRLRELRDSLPPAPERGRPRPPGEPGRRGR